MQYWFWLRASVSLAWPAVYSIHFTSLAPPELIGPREERACILSSRAGSKARFTPLSRTRPRSSRKEGRRSGGGPSPKGSLPFLKSPTRPQMEAADSGKADGGSGSVHGVGSPLGVEWGCRVEGRLWGGGVGSAEQKPRQVDFLPSLALSSPCTHRAWLAGTFVLEHLAC